MRVPCDTDVKVSSRSVSSGLPRLPRVCDNDGSEWVFAR